MAPDDPPPPRRPDDWVETLDRTGSAGIGGAFALGLGGAFLEARAHVGAVGGALVGGASVAALVVLRRHGDRSAFLGFATAGAIAIAAVALDALLARLRA
jgi:hypothetical protein